MEMVKMRTAHAHIIATWAQHHNRFPLASSMQDHASEVHACVEEEGKGGRGGVISDTKNFIADFWPVGLPEKSSVLNTGEYRGP